VIPGENQAGTLHVPQFLKTNFYTWWISFWYPPGMRVKKKEKKITMGFSKNDMPMPKM
jgi:hypothetical protein